MSPSAARWLRRIVYGVAAFLILTTIVAFVIANRLKTTYNVSAKTERLKFTSQDAPPSRWALEDVRLIQDYSVVREHFSGYLQFAPGVEVIIERVASGPLYAHVSLTKPQNSGSATNTSHTASVGQFLTFDDHPAGDAGKTLELFVTNLRARAERGSSVVLQITGSVEIGRKVGFESHGTTALLRTAKVTMLGHTLLGGNLFEAGQATLEIGDQFSVQKPESPSQGFVLIDEEPGLSAAYRTVGTGGVVERPGGGSYQILATPLDRLLHDPFFIGLSVTMSSLLALFKLFEIMQSLVESRTKRAVELPLEDERGISQSIAGRSGIGLLFLLSVLCPSTVRGQASVLVKSAENGQGLLRGRESSCFAVVPKHLVDMNVGAIEVAAAGALKSTAQIERLFPSSDLALLRVNGGDVKCSAWTLPSKLSDVLASSGGYLRTLEESGSETRLQVDIARVTDEYIVVRPRSASDRLRKTMSGSALIVDGLVVGELMKVCADSGEDCRAGDGDVLRIDALARLTDGFFRLSEASTPKVLVPPVAPTSLAGPAPCPRDGRNSPASSALQRIGNLVATIKSKSGAGSGVVQVAVEFTNSPDAQGAGIAIAFKPRSTNKYTDARADFSDDGGGKYRLESAETLPFARTSEEWVTLGPCESKIVVLTFTNLVADPNGFRSRNTYNISLSADIWVAAQEPDQRISIKSATVYLSKPNN